MFIWYILKTIVFTRRIEDASALCSTAYAMMLRPLIMSSIQPLALAFYAIRDTNAQPILVVHDRPGIKGLRNRKFVSKLMDMSFTNSQVPGLSCLLIALYIALALPRFFS